MLGLISSGLHCWASTVDQEASQSLHNYFGHQEAETQSMALRSSPAIFNGGTTLHEPMGLPNGLKVLASKRVAMPASKTVT